MDKTDMGIGTGTGRKQDTGTVQQKTVPGTVSGRLAAFSAARKKTRERLARMGLASTLANDAVDTVA